MARQRRGGRRKHGKEICSSTPEGGRRVPSRPDYAARSQPDAWLPANLDDELDSLGFEGATDRLKLVDRRHTATLFEITNHALAEVSELRQSDLSQVYERSGGARLSWRYLPRGSFPPQSILTP